MTLSRFYHLKVRNISHFWWYCLGWGTITLTISHPISRVFLWRYIRWWVCEIAPYRLWKVDHFLFYKHTNSIFDGVFRVLCIFAQKCAIGLNVGSCIRKGNLFEPHSDRRAISRNGVYQPICPESWGIKQPNAGHLPTNARKPLEHSLIRHHVSVMLSLHSPQSQ